MPPHEQNVAKAKESVEASPTEQAPRWWNKAPLGGLIATAICLFVMGFTIRDYGLTTDEPIYILNTERHLLWFQDLFEQGPGFAFQPERLAEGFYVARPENKNLPANTLIAAAGYLTIGRFDSPPASYRWGNVIIFAVTCGVIYQWLSRELSSAAGIVGLLALIGTPRLFAQAHLLNIDTLVGCFWVLAAWALYYSRGNWKWSLLFGALCGVGMMTKPTFWFALPLFCVWGLVYRPRELWRAAVSLAIVTPLTALALIPLWWSNPLGGFFDYIALLREKGNGWQIDAYYLGEVYQMTGLPPVPWHAVILLPSVTTPLWILFLGAAGVLRWLRRFRTDALLGLWWGSAITLPVIVMLPSTPAHDGLRLYRASFFFLPLLAAGGFQGLVQTWLIKLQPPTRLKIEYAAILGFALLTLWPLWWMHPGEMSYYNWTVGGLSGAAQPVEILTPRGRAKRPRFEIDYWWAAMDQRAWADMQQHLPQGAKLWVFPEHFGLDRLQEWGHLRPDIEIVGPENSEYLLLYGRLGRLMDPRSGNLGRIFLEGQPVWELKIDNTRVAALYQR